MARIHSPISHFISGAVEDYMKFSLDRGHAGCALHDPLTLAAVIAPELLAWEEYYVYVDMAGGVSMGNTLADFHNISGKPAKMKAAMGVRGDEFVGLFLQRMENLCGMIPD